MLKKIALYLLILATSFDLVGGYAVASSLNATSVKVCRLESIPLSPDSQTVIRKATAEVVLMAAPVTQEDDETEVLRFGPAFPFPVNGISHFLPLLRAGPAARASNFSSNAKGVKAPLFVLNCNFRI